VGLVKGSVHKFDDGHKFAGAASASVVAGRTEARDCCGLAGAGFIGLGGGAALRGECEPGFCLAQALSRRGERRCGCSIDGGDSEAGSGTRACPGCGERVDRDRAGRRLPGAGRPWGQGVGVAAGAGRVGAAKLSGGSAISTTLSGGGLIVGSGGVASGVIVDKGFIYDQARLPARVLALFVGPLDIDIALGPSELRYPVPSRQALAALNSRAA
jgi:hypothetical protein